MWTFVGVRFQTETDFFFSMKFLRCKILNRIDFFSMWTFPGVRHQLNWMAARGDFWDLAETQRETILLTTQRTWRVLTCIGKGQSTSVRSVHTLRGDPNGVFSCWPVPNIDIFLMKIILTVLFWHEILSLTLFHYFLDFASLITPHVLFPDRTVCSGGGKSNLWVARRRVSWTSLPLPSSSVTPTAPALSGESWKTCQPRSVLTSGGQAAPRPSGPSPHVSGRRLTRTRRRMWRGRRSGTSSAAMSCSTRKSPWRCWTNSPRKPPASTLYFPIRDLEGADRNLQGNTRCMTSLALDPSDPLCGRRARKHHLPNPK